MPSTLRRLAGCSGRACGEKTRAAASSSSRSFSSSHVRPCSAGRHGSAAARRERRVPTQRWLCGTSLGESLSSRRRHSRSWRRDGSDPFLCKCVALPGQFCAPAKGRPVSYGPSWSCPSFFWGWCEDCGRRSCPTIVIAPMVSWSSCGRGRRASVSGCRSCR